MDRRLLLTVVALVGGIIANQTTLAAVGRTVGTFGVSPIGAAQYTIPIWSPPGIHNLQPKLALSYDSSLSYGVMGPGWTLSGLSAITRCNPTFAQDPAPASITLTSADGLCLDGNRLRGVPVGSTSTYQTEIANFSQVTAESINGVTGPGYFKVQATNGLIYEYGYTTDSRVFSSQGAAAPYTWALDKVTDRAGNVMSFSYTQAGGTYVLKSIEYGPSSNQNNISFTYSTLQSTSPNILSHSIAGTQIQQTQQLSSITVAVGPSNTALRAYNLLYSTSAGTLRATLTSITECGNASGTGTGATDCLPATIVGYQAGVVGIVNPITASGSGTTNGTVYSVDIDGDGKQDLVYAVTSGSNFQWWVQLATASGYGSPINTGAVSPKNADFLLDDFDASGAIEILAPVSNVFWAYKWNGTGFTSTSTHINVIAGVNYSSADVDGDGRPDLVNIQPSSTANTIVIGFQLNTSSSGSISFVQNPVDQALPLGPVLKMQMYGNNQLVNSSVKHFDFDGDGRQDLLLYYTDTTDGATWTNLYPLLTRGTGAPPLSAGSLGSPGIVPQFMALNWNDDACTDVILGQVIEISPCNSNAGVQVNIGVGSNTGESPVAAVDWDGDGRTDLLTQKLGSNTFDVIRSQGYQPATEVSTSITNTNPDSYVVLGTYVVTDKNGDGLDDLVFTNSAASYAISYGLHNGASMHPDLADSFVDGNGNSIGLAYSSIAQNTYTPYSDATYPYQNFIGPLYVVNAATISDPSSASGGTYQMTYWYYGAWVNLQGRGFQAFYATNAFDHRNGLQHYQYYARSFPSTGLTNQDVVWNGTVFPTQTVNTLAVNTLESSANNERYFPYIENSVQSDEEMGGALNGTIVTTTATTYTFDNYGNPTKVVTTVADNDSTSPYYNDSWTSTTERTITPNTSNWCLNLASAMTVTNTAPGVSALTRSVNYTPDYVNCRETAEVVAPSTNYQVTTGYGYDGFGNLDSQAVTGVGMATRTTSFNWGATGQFLTSVTNAMYPVGNALAQTTTYNSSSSGTLTSVADPNGVTTSWLYDDFARKTRENRTDGTYTVWSYNDCATTGGCLFGPHALAVIYYVYNVGGSLLTDGTTEFDQIDRPVLTNAAALANGVLSRNDTRYDNMGRLAQQSMPCTWVNVTTSCPYWTSYNYDVLDRITVLERPISASNSSLQTTQYTYQGRTSTVQDPLGNTTTKIAQVTGNLGRSQGPNGYYQNFTYDAFGSLISIKDSASPANTLFTATYGYGTNAFQTSSTDLDLGSRSYTVDALGEITAYSDSNSQNFSRTYDALSRPLVRTEPDLTTSWTWGTAAASHNIGNLQSVSAASSVGSYSDSFTYDGHGRPSTKTSSLPGDTSYTYTASYNATTGLLDTLQYPASTSSYQLKIQYAYANGILSSIADFNAPTTVFWTANAMNPRGQVTQETLGNGVVTARAFDAVTGWLGSIQSAAGGGTALQHNTFSYDQDGNVTQRQDNNQGLSENFYYDNMNRLNHSTLNGAVNLQMTYDTIGMGNIAARTDVAGGSAWTYDPVKKHQVTQAGSSAYTYTYDGNGNAQTRNGYGISWSSYNYPTGVGSLGEWANFYYGPNRERWKTVYSGSIGLETTYHAGKLLEKVAGSTGQRNTCPHLIRWRFKTQGLARPLIQAQCNFV